MIGQRVRREGVLRLAVSRVGPGEQHLAHAGLAPRPPRPWRPPPGAARAASARASAPRSLPDRPSRLNLVRRRSPPSSRERGRTAALRTEGRGVGLHGRPLVVFRRFRRFDAFSSRTISVSARSARRCTSASRDPSRLPALQVSKSSAGESHCASQDWRCAPRCTGNGIALMTSCSETLWNVRPCCIDHRAVDIVHVLLKRVHQHAFGVGLRGDQLDFEFLCELRLGRPLIWSAWSVP